MAGGGPRPKQSSLWKPLRPSTRGAQKSPIARRATFTNCALDCTTAKPFSPPTTPIASPRSYASAGCVRERRSEPLRLTSLGTDVGAEQTAAAAGLKPSVLMSGAAHAVAPHDTAWLLKQLEQENEHLRAWAIKLLIDPDAQAELDHLAEHIGLVGLGDDIDGGAGVAEGVVDEPPTVGP